MFLVSLLLLVNPCIGQDFSLGELEEDFRLGLEFPSHLMPKNPEMDIIIVRGSKIDLFERIILDAVIDETFAINPQAKIIYPGNKTEQVTLTINKKLLYANETTLEELSQGITLIVLVGKRKHNRITEEAYASGIIVNESTKYMGQLIIGKGKTDTDSKIMAFYHKTSEGKLEREAVKYSPLKEFMPEEYVPVAATGIGMFLMSLINIFKTVIEFLALDIGRKRKAFGHVGPKIRGIYVREILAVIGAALVFSFAVTWTFAGPTTRFLELLMLNIAICLFAALSHELSHRLVGRLFGVKIEYRFWYTGSFITILTAFLGNSFGIQGFLLERADKNIARWKIAVIKLTALITSTFVTVFFALLYLTNPAVMFQMIYTTASIYAMAEIMPVRGLDGYDIRSWNRIIWILFFLIITAVFFAVNFIQ